MRYRLMATYRGVPYEVGLGPSNFEVVLFAACPPPEELGFEPATGHWRKQVIRAEIDALWESRPVGTFRGEPCIVLDDPGDRPHIAYVRADPDRAASRPPGMTAPRRPTPHGPVPPPPTSRWLAHRTPTSHWPAPHPPARHGPVMSRPTPSRPAPC